IYDASTSSYLILDQDGAVLRRWFPAMNKWVLVYGKQVAPVGFPSQPRDGPLDQAIFGRSAYSRSVMALQADGSRLFLWDAAHFIIRRIDFNTSMVSTLSGWNYGPLVNNPTWTATWQGGFFNASVSS